MEKVMSGADRIVAERRRQLDKEHYSPEHDDCHDDCSLAIAAACYAASAAGFPIYEKKDYANSVAFVDPWPWTQKDDRRPYGELLKDSTARMGSNVLATDVTSDEAIRLLEKAGALIAAEIDRLLRAKRPRKKRGRK